MSANLVTVILPVYNEQNNIARAIKSIIDQTLEDWQLFIIDDGSTDRTREIISEFSKRDARIKPFRNEMNLGITKCLNFGIKKCNTKYIARMDADDYSYPERLEKQVQFMESNQNIDVLGTAARLMTKNGVEIGIHYCPKYYKTLVKQIHLRTPFLHPSIIAKTTFFKKWHYSNKFPFCEDYELWIRTFPDVRFHNLREVLIEYTVPEHTSIKRQLNSSRCVLFSKNINLLQKGIVLARTAIILLLMSFQIYKPKIKKNK